MSQEAKCTTDSLHNSSDPLYCSECGSPMSASDLVATAGDTGESQCCPVCHTTRDGLEPICGGCGYDFESGHHDAGMGELMVGVPTSKSAAPVEDTGCAVVSESATGADVVDSDAGRLESDCGSESDETDFTYVIEVVTRFQLAVGNNLVGRRTSSIEQQIPLGDSHASARHCLVNSDGAGGFSVTELGSTNGTTLNGCPLEESVCQPLKIGDQLVVAENTVLRLVRVQNKAVCGEQT